MFGKAPGDGQRYDALTARDSTKRQRSEEYARVYRRGRSVDRSGLLPMLPRREAHQETSSSKKVDLQEGEADPQESDAEVVDPGSLWTTLSTFERDMARRRKDAINSRVVITGEDSRTCILHARADWPAKHEPFKNLDDFFARLLPYHSCYLPEVEDKSAENTTQVLSSVETRVQNLRNKAQLCRCMSAQESGKRKLNVMK